MNGCFGKSSNISDHSSQHQSQDSQISQKNTFTSEKVFGSIIVKLESKIQNLEIKVSNLINATKLLQQYSQRKDMQYEKERSNIAFFEQKYSCFQQLAKQIQNKFNSFDRLTHRVMQVFKDVDEIKKENYQIKNFRIKKEKEMEKSLIRELDDKICYEIEQIKTKINKIESNLLHQRKQISREEFRVTNNHEIEEVLFRINKIENQMASQKANTSRKLQNLKDKIISSEEFKSNQYGLNSKKTSTKQSRNKQKDKKLKSKQNERKKHQSLDFNHK